MDDYEYAVMIGETVTVEGWETLEVANESLVRWKNLAPKLGWDPDRFVLVRRRKAGPVEAVAL